jgi:hypothetical protein
MLDLVRFSTNDPARLTRELDRFVLAVRRELEAAARAAAQRFVPRSVTSGIAGSTVAVTAKLGELVPVNPALGPVDVYLPRATPADAGRSLLITVRDATNAVRIQPGVPTINMGAGPVTLSVVAAYLVTWDSSGWWTVYHAP